MFSIFKLTFAFHWNRFYVLFISLVIGQSMNLAMYCPNLFLFFIDFANDPILIVPTVIGIGFFCNKTPTSTASLRISSSFCHEWCHVFSYISSSTLFCIAFRSSFSFQMSIFDDFIHHYNPLVHEEVVAECELPGFLFSI